MAILKAMLAKRPNRHSKRFLSAKNSEIQDPKVTKLKQEIEKVKEKNQQEVEK